MYEQVQDLMARNDVKWKLKSYLVRGKPDCDATDGEFLYHSGWKGARIVERHETGLVLVWT